MLRELDHNIWVSEQPLKYFGLSVATRMTVIRLTNGELIVISPIQVDDATIDQINKLGTVSYIVVPNLYHHLFAASFKNTYPKALLLASPGLESKRPDLVIDRFLPDVENIFKDEVEYLLFDGIKTFGLSGTALLNEFVFFHRASKTLVLTDTAFHFDESFSPLTQLVARLIGDYKKLSPSWLEKLSTRETEKVRQSVQNILFWDFERVIMAHGSVLENDGKRQFKEGYEWFLGTSLKTVK
jgi:Domain of unknown function (DUF4336)